MASEPRDQLEFRILSLDGGGAKGVYTLGVLKEIAAAYGEPLSKHFDLIYGTSTGAIIAALIGLGRSVEEIESLYLDAIPYVMQGWRAKDRTARLMSKADAVFSKTGFGELETRVGIVATGLNTKRPMIFKSHPDQSVAGRHTFVPGFGCTIAEAVVASSAAYPFFEQVKLQVPGGDTRDLIDGGFSANNPTLFAITDALGPLSIPRADLRVLSIGVGHYQEPSKKWHARVLWKMPVVKMVTRSWEISTNTVEVLRTILFKDVRCVRVDEGHFDPEYATDLLESNERKLRKLIELGRESYRHEETNIASIFSLDRRAR